MPLPADGKPALLHDEVIYELPVGLVEPVVALFEFADVEPEALDLSVQIRGKGGKDAAQVKKALRVPGHDMAPVHAGEERQKPDVAVEGGDGPAPQAAVHDRNQVPGKPLAHYGAVGGHDAGVWRRTLRGQEIELEHLVLVAYLPVQNKYAEGGQAVVLYVGRIKRRYELPRLHQGVMGIVGSQQAGLDVVVFKHLLEFRQAQIIGLVSHQPPELGVPELNLFEKPLLAGHCHTA